MTENKIPFNSPYMTGKELYYIAEAKFNNMLAGDGPFTKRCHQWLNAYTTACKSLLTHSCTAALEMSALLLDIEPGDEIIMPSYTFVSTANAFVLRGGKPVFVDIRADTLNIDEQLIADAITPRTKAIVPVHYAGVGCEMDTIMNIAKQHHLHVVEDAAQGMNAYYKGKPLGSIGDLGAFSFHETKNIICGEGGALIVNNAHHAERAEIIREKGTDRSRFFRGEIDKYTWQEVGSSFLPGELIAAFLWAQLEEVDNISKKRMQLWQHYHQLLAQLEEHGFIQRPVIPEDCEHNAHMYYILLSPEIDRQHVLTQLKQQNIHAVFHYVPLHHSPAGLRYTRVHGEMKNTNELSERLIRLPLWIGMTEQQQEYIVSTLEKILDQNKLIFMRQYK